MKAVPGAAEGAVPVAVFDEVDTGVGGRIGAQVGSTLRQLATAQQVTPASCCPPQLLRSYPTSLCVASMMQVVCVTHLPQVGRSCQLALCTAEVG